MIDWRQGYVLADRYLETLLAERRRMGLLVAQAPLLALLLIAAASASALDGDVVHTCAALSVLWMGGVDGHLEILRERTFLWRERHFDLEIGAYLYSKMRGLALLGTVQTGIYGLVVHVVLDPDVPIGWWMLVLLAGCLCGTSLGLLVSAFATVRRRATFVVHLLVFGQVPLLVVGDLSSRLTPLRHLVPLTWSRDALATFANSGAFIEAAARAAVPLVVGAGCVWLAGLILARTSERRR